MAERTKKWRSTHAEPIEIVTPAGIESVRLVQAEGQLMLTFVSGSEAHLTALYRQIDAHLRRGVLFLENMHPASVEEMQ